jgi:hypothetical protein
VEVNMETSSTVVKRSSLVALAAVLAVLTLPASAGPGIAFTFSTGAPNNLMGAASRPPSAGKIEIEAADDFVTSTPVTLTGATFTGLLIGGATTSSITHVVVEIYRVFPKDSDTVRVPNVPTRTNSPSDVAFDSRDSTVPTLTFLTNVLSNDFTVLNTVLPGGIHPSPNQTTGGNGPASGIEVLFTVTFTTPFSLPADHYFFIPQVAVSTGEFLWLSGERPITTGTPFSPDLQSWTRDANLDPDWLRIGNDIVGGQTPPTFNGAFSLSGTVVVPTSTPTPTPTPTPTTVAATPTPTATPIPPTSTATVTPTTTPVVLGAASTAIPTLGAPGLALLALLVAASALALTLARRI